MDTKRYGVHAAHCCKECGCKYFEDDCPVVNGLVEAEYSCYDCEEDREALVESLKKLDPEELAEVMRLVFEGK